MDRRESSHPCPGGSEPGPGVLDEDAGAGPLLWFLAGSPRPAQWSAL
ncbi:hypothetical protein [Acidipropionibacterium virtanenii]|nr:hypothetical protein [Acidipropionibacterium virtanenii]